MEQVQEALVGLLSTVLVGVIGLMGAYATVLIKKAIDNIKAKTIQIEDETTRLLIDNALERTAKLVYVNVVKAEQTLVKEIIEKTEDGKIDKGELKDVALVVKNDVVSQLSSQVYDLLKVEIDDIDGYIFALIEKSLAELKGQI